VLRRRPGPRFTLVKPIRFAPEEWDKIRARAADVRLPPSTYVRQTALAYRLSGRINSRAIYELGRIGNNLNQLTRVANARGRIDQAKRLSTVLNEITEAMRRLA
jgi:hypothetical protein